MNIFEKFFKVIDKIAYVLAAVSVGGMLACVFLQVAARIGQFSIDWTTELSQYFFLWSSSFGAYIVARRNKMIGVELIQKMLPSPVRRVVKFVALLCGAAFYALVDYYVIVPARARAASPLVSLMKQTTPVLKWPMGVIYIVMMSGLAVLALYFVYAAFRALFEPGANKPAAPKTAEQIAEEVE